MSFLTGVLDLLFPPRCVFCRRFLEKGESGICKRCEADLPYTSNGGEQVGKYFSLCAAPLYYEKDVRESIHRYKFQDAELYAPIYGKLVAACVRDRLSGQFDIISWPPLSQKRLRERGYDQAMLLAKAVAAQLGTEAVPTLEKIRDTAKQSQTGAAEQRRANIAGAYRVPEPERVRDKRILLIDDVVTTGSTLDECARTLRGAGARAAFCAALARGDTFS